MNKRYTPRGFALIEFSDRKQNECSIQKSSLATEDAIWMGINNANPQIMASSVVEGGVGWVSYPLPEGVNLTTRMELTQEQVRELLPILEHFIETGELLME